MSFWTYCVGAIRVDVPGQTNEEVMYIVGTALKHLPKVTGSEHDMQVSYHLCEGYSCSSSYDELGQMSNLYDDERFQTFETQTHVVITVNGWFRDRMLGETVKEFSNWLCRLAKRLPIDQCSVQIADYSREVLFTNKNDWLSEMYDNDGPWSDYLQYKPTFFRTVLPEKLKAMDDEPAEN